MTGVADGSMFMDPECVERPSEPRLFFRATSILSSHSFRTTCLLARSSPNSASVLHPVDAILASVAANASSSSSI